MTLAGESFDLESRKAKFELLSRELAASEDIQFISTAKKGEKQSAWGTTEVMDLAGEKVFVKRIPLTDLEREHRPSTNNHYDLPTFFNYGIGSVGLNAFRELAANIKCTEWVLSGEYPYFPLMYHHRVLPVANDQRQPDHKADEDFVNYWADNKSVERYMRDRCEAKHELVLFMEHFPACLSSWIEDHLGQLQPVIDSLFRTARFLSSKGVIHFDAHFENVVTDGEQMYLTDFGLVLDREFELNEAEKIFFESHSHFDFARIVACLGFQLYNRYCALSKNEQLELKSHFQLPVGATDREATFALMAEAEHLSDHGLRLDPEYLQVLLKYREAYACMYRFSTDLIHRADKSARFPNEEMRRLLAQAGLVE